MTRPQSPGLLRRLAAICYDTLILGAILIAATAATLPFSRGGAISAGTLWYQLYLGSVVLLYFTGFWWRAGQTIGMVAWRLRVVSQRGKSITLMQSLMRAATAVVSWLAAGLGFLWVLVDREGRAWHDLMSGTKLVVEDRFSAPAPTPPQ